MKIVDEIEREAAALRASEGSVWDHPDGTWEGGMRKYQRTIADDACERAVRQGTLTFAHMLDAMSRRVLAEEDKAKLREHLVATAALSTLWIKKLDHEAGR